MAKKYKYGNVLIGFSEFKCPYCDSLTDFSDFYLLIRDLQYKESKCPYTCPICRNTMILDISRRRLIKSPDIFNELHLTKEQYMQIESSIKKIYCCKNKNRSTINCTGYCDTCFYFIRSNSELNQSNKRGMVRKDVRK